MFGAGERAQHVGHKTTAIGTEAAASPPGAGDRCPGSHRTKQATAGQDSCFEKTQGCSFSINEDGDRWTSHSHFHCTPFLAVDLLSQCAPAPGCARGAGRKPVPTRYCLTLHKGNPALSRSSNPVQLCKIL